MADDFLSGSTLPGASSTGSSGPGASLLTQPKPRPGPNPESGLSPQPPGAGPPLSAWYGGPQMSAGVKAPTPAAPAASPVELPETPMPPTASPPPQMPPRIQTAQQSIQAPAPGLLSPYAMQPPAMSPAQPDTGPALSTMFNMPQLSGSEPAPGLPRLPDMSSAQRRDDMDYWYRIYG